MDKIFNTNLNDTVNSAPPVKIKKNFWIIVAVVAVIAVVVIIALVVFLLSHKKSPLPSSQKTPTLGGTISEKIQNPISGKLPDTNPFKAQKNPLDSIYQNPFK